MPHPYVGSQTSVPEVYGKRVESLYKPLIVSVLDERMNEWIR